MQPQFITLVPHAKDLTNQRFGRLMAIGPVGRNKKRQIIWLCRCDCGKTVSVTSVSLRSTNTQSCGCLRIAKATERVKIHGLRRHPLYETWNSMISRCKDNNRNHYNLYAGRGIDVCQEWKENVQSFIDHVEQLSHAGEKGYSLDRTDNSLGYFPGNVRWATATEQARNTRRNRMLTHNGKTQCIVDWAYELGISSETIHSRLRLGWNTERTLTQPVKKPITKSANREKLPLPHSTISIQPGPK